MEKTLFETRRTAANALVSKLRGEEMPNYAKEALIGLLMVIDTYYYVIDQQESTPEEGSAYATRAVALEKFIVREIAIVRRNYGQYTEYYLDEVVLGF